MERQEKYDINTEYLESSVYFDKSSAKIRKIAEGILYNNPLVMSIDIASVVQKRILYKEMNYSMRIDEILEKGIGDCTEYSDLFITIARIKNIPSRFVNGYVINNDAVYPHDWVEIYTTAYGWLCVDLSYEGKDIFRNWDNRLILTYNRYDKVLKGYHIFYYLTSGDGASEVKMKINDLRS